MIHETLPQYQINFIQNIDSTIRPLPQTEVSEESFIDHQYGFDPYWEDHRYGQDNLEYRYTYDKPIEQFEVDDIIDDSHVSDTLRHALIDLWTINSQLPGTSPLPHFTRFFHPNKLGQQPVIDNETALQLKSTPDGSIKILQLSTNLHRKNKRKMLYFPMDFGDLTIDSLIEKGALSSAITEADFVQIKQIAPQKILKEGLPSDFQIMVDNGQLETPIATTELQLAVGDITFVERFIVLSNLANPRIGLLSL